MILKHFRHLSAALGLLCAQAAAASDATFIAAYDAYRAGDPNKFARAAGKLEGHLLNPWLEYWELSMRLEDAEQPELDAYFTRHAGLYPAELLRAEWLKVLGRRGDWAHFERELKQYPREDLEIRCYSLLSQLLRGEEGATAEFEQKWWREPAELPDGCGKVADWMFEHQRLDVDDVWRRVRVLFEKGQITAAKTALGYLSKADSPDERALAEAARQPKRLLDRLPKTLDKRAAREVALLAAVRLARNDPPAAAQQVLDRRLGVLLAEADVKYLWGLIGYEAARELLPEALAWYALAGDAALEDDKLAWKARAALRAGRWGVVRESIDAMSATARLDPAWAYWYGRALAASGDETGSRAHYLRIAGRADFYGLLASEELGYVLTLPEAAYAPSEAEVEAARNDAGLARALEMIRLGVRLEGVREWLHTIRYYEDEKLHPAAECARRAEVYDRAIQAADRTVRRHNFGLRYPVPYEDVFREYAASEGLDQAWVLGIVRQESRFIVDARSGRGAAGLMQVMPHTARLVAQRKGMRNYRAKSVTDVETNITLGTGYLKMVLDQLGHPVLASAAYNAGPSRARRWRDARPLEGAVYAETIPFPETRDYVKKITANTVFYAALLNGPATPVKARLGVVPARSGAELPLDEEPQ